MDVQHAERTPLPPVHSEKASAEDIMCIVAEVNTGNDTDVVIVGFQNGAAEDPQEWSRAYRWSLTTVMGILGFASTFALPAPVGFAAQLLAELELNDELLALTISLFVIGTCVGTWIWSPLSEHHGRRSIYIYSLAVFTCIQVGAALSQNAASLECLRLLSGIFIAAAYSNGSTVMADIWDAETREKVVVVSSITSFIGTSFAPLIGGYMAQGGVHWTWIFWLLAIVGGLFTLIFIFAVPETYPPAILRKKAVRLRERTGDVRYRAPVELEPERSLLATITYILAKPFIICVREPMLIAVNIYLGFISGCSYMLFEVYPIIFQGGYHFTSGQVGLVYLPPMVGELAGLAIYVYVVRKRYLDRAKKGASAAEPESPEAGLTLALWGGPIFAASFFWLGWTSSPSISLWVPLLSGFFIGLSLLWLMLAFVNYIIAVYLPVVASALASSLVIRSIFGAIFPLFSNQMFDVLSPRWASTLVGCVALMLVPVPFVLRRYGPALRARSRYIQPA
ncbi:MFS general substrate transporter [Pilatotrama ljubarskyi]|nr:MFS general substrate transporter [Pilatotrama ljubarskyi]